MSQCEEINCYCQKPGNKGGDVYQVHDNIEERDVYRCDVAIDGNPTISKCSFCREWMIFSMFTLKKNFNICYMCYREIDIYDLFDQVFPTPCVMTRVFDEYFGGEKDHNPECTECHRRHLVFTPTEDEPTLASIYAPELTEYYEDFFLDTFQMTDEIQKRVNKLFTLALNALKAAKSKKIAEVIKRKLEKEATYQRRDSARKRLIRMMMPATSLLNDTEIDALPAKFARVKCDDDIDHINRLHDNPSSMTHDDVLEFVNFIANCD